jgi:hypothetical protein
MSIAINYDREVDVQRLTAGDGETQEYTAHISDVACHIQPLDEAFSDSGDGKFGKDWMMFCDADDILEGDHVIDGEKTYTVVGIERFNFLGRDRHMEMRIREYS